MLGSPKTSPWIPVAIDWEALGAPAAPVGRKTSPSDRVKFGDLWLLGEHKVACSHPGDARAIKLLCGQERPALRYMAVMPDTKQRWWSTTGLSIEGREEYWPGWEPLRLALNGERERAGWSDEDIEKITRDPRSGYWFHRGDEWEPIPRGAYEALAGAGNGVAFAHPYNAVQAVIERLQEAQDKDADFLEPLLRGVDSVLVLGSVLPAALVAAERAGGRVFGALADPGTCERAIEFWEQQSGRMAEKA